MSATQPYLLGIESDAMRVNDEIKQKALSQWYTAPDLAARVWGWMWRQHGPSFGSKRVRLLEPSAGEGALIWPVIQHHFNVGEIVAYDIDPANAQHLQRTLTKPLADEGIAFDVRCGDFLADPDPGEFDLAVMNPPYEDDQDVEFARRVLGCCAVVGGIFATRMQYSGARSGFWRNTDIAREVVLSKRPRFGGGFTPMTDFCVLDLVRREQPKQPGDTCATLKEWWT